MKKFTLICISMLACLVMLAQPGALDLTFDPTFTTNHGTSGLALQPDGKILMAFNQLDSAQVYTSRLIRLWPNGAIDSSFYTGNFANESIEDIAVQPDGKIVFSGRFSMYAQQAAGSIARVLADGTPDTSFVTGTGFNSPVYDIKLQADNKIVAGGIFTQYNSTFCNHLARLHTNGSLDTTFNTGSGANGSVNALAIQPDGRIIIGGDFVDYNGGMHFRIARVNTDGSRDISFGDTSGASAVVDYVTLQPDDKILIGGNLNQYDFQPRSKIARILPNNGLDGMFFSQQAANAVVRDIQVISLGHIIIAGDFTSFAGTVANRFVKVNDNCLIDTTFNTGTGANASVYRLAVQPDSKILAVGGFTQYNGTPRPYIARIYNCLTPQPDSIYGIDYALCQGTPQTYTLTPVSGATKYEWTLPNGWQGSSDSTSITAISSGSGGTITVKAFTDSCGWSYVTSRTINTIAPPGVDICLVTVDTASTHNIVIWEKPITTLIDSFLIYREIAANQYSKIASVSYSELSEYHDTTANPNATSYRYKISVLDTCGAESELSEYHNTIHLQYLGSGNFQWTFYQIEPGINPVTSFNLYRDALNNGNFSQIGFVPGTNSTYSDLTYASFPNANYVVDVNWNKTCTPSRQVSTTRSNIRRGGGIIQNIISGQPTETGFRIYPNPAKAFVTVSVAENMIGKTLTVYDMTGKEMAAVQLQTINYKLETDSWSAGIYYVKLGTAVKRLVIQ